MLNEPSQKTDDRRDSMINAARFLQDVLDEESQACEGRPDTNSTRKLYAQARDLPKPTDCSFVIELNCGLRRSLACASG